MGVRGWREFGGLREWVLKGSEGLRGPKGGFKGFGVSGWRKFRGFRGLRGLKGVKGVGGFGFFGAVGLELRLSSGGEENPNGRQKRIIVPTQVWEIALGVALWFL